MKGHLLPMLGLLVVFSSGCPSSTPLQPGALDLTFIDSRSFDQQLSAALASGYSVVAVETLSEISPNDIPERLDRWLYAISSRGGVVKAERDPRLPEPRSFGAAEILSLAIAVYGEVSRELEYRPAAAYGAIVYVDPNRDRVTRILFVHVPPQ